MWLVGQQLILLFLLDLFSELLDTSSASQNFAHRLILDFLAVVGG
jgi:hypothetical protein